MVKVYAEDTPAVVMMAHRRAWKDGDGYRVYRRNGKPLRILLDVCQIDLDEYVAVPRCPCESGVWEKPCWHAAVVHRRTLREKVTA
jgi:hypothetical protein